MHLRPKDGFLSPDASNVGTEVLWNAPRRRHTATSSSTDGDLQSRFPEARWKKSPKCYGNRPKLAGKHTEVGWKTYRSWLENRPRSLSEQLPKSNGTNPEASWKKVTHKSHIICRLHKTNVPYCLHSSCFL